MTAAVPGTCTQRTDFCQWLDGGRGQCNGYSGEGLVMAVFETMEKEVSYGVRIHIGEDGQ
ncbi:putative serine protease 55-like isoform X1 [Sesbania bispinosa]|nr:putative serine protease 55-like isoform X1 [Sesbania bispinosa]